MQKFLLQIMSEMIIKNTQLENDNKPLPCWTQYGG